MADKKRRYPGSGVAARAGAGVAASAYDLTSGAGKMDFMVDTILKSFKKPSGFLSGMELEDAFQAWKLAAEIAYSVESTIGHPYFEDCWEEHVELHRRVKRTGFEACDALNDIYDVNEQWEEWMKATGQGDGDGDGDGDGGGGGDGNDDDDDDDDNAVAASCAVVAPKKHKK